ncbi:MAG: hypothetical protein QUV05_23040 [Phycisphaerae bacterium]|nr:hypothetical protein [Phycisphaerae bacterium]
MEVHGQSDVAKPDKVSAATSPQADSVPHDGPLADASCLRCGYSLRGLTENRCPECGTPFDPEQMASSYLPEWPRLVVWDLTALCVAVFLELISLALEALSTNRPILWYLLAGNERNPLILFDSVTTILIAPFALIGLIRRIDWGRKIAVGMYLLQFAPLLPASFRTIFTVVSAGLNGQLDAGVIWYVLRLWRLASQFALPSLILACVLCTRLARTSLRRSSLDVPLRLPRTVFPPRNDWLPILVALLAVSALISFGWLVETAIWMIWLAMDNSSFGIAWWEDVASPASWTLLLAAQTVCFAWITRDILRNPASTRRHLKSFLVVATVGFIAGQTINLLFNAEVYSFSSLETAVYSVLGILASALACLSMPLALYLYASRALPAEAIARVAESSEQPTSSNASGSADG